jgi:heme exporter protein A
VSAASVSAQLRAASAPAAIDAIEVTQLTKRYGFHRALAGVSLEFQAGQLCALLGPNGAGKSTLLGILSTLVRPSAGKVRYRRGREAAASGAELRRSIGVLAHDSFLYGELTGVENLAFYAKLYGVVDASARARALLDEVGLDEAARHRQARTYSRGMAQRLALARTLLHDPQVLLLDEPFTGLDRAGAAALSRTLARARAERRVVIVVSHDLEALAGETDHVVVLRRGKVAFDERAERGYAYDELKDIYHRFTE